MMALILKRMILVVMGNHVYSFNGKNRLQLEGGPIGLKVSGVLAKVCMLRWSKDFLAKLAAAVSGVVFFAMYLLLFYVDDTFLAMEELEAGSRLVEGKVVVVEEEVEGDLEVRGDVRTAKVIKDIANYVFDFLRFELDCPSN